LGAVRRSRQLSANILESSEQRTLKRLSFPLVIIDTGTPFISVLPPRSSPQL